MTPPTAVTESRAARIARRAVADNILEVGDHTLADHQRAHRILMGEEDHTPAVVWATAGAIAALAAVVRWSGGHDDPELR